MIVPCSLKSETSLFTVVVLVREALVTPGKIGFRVLNREMAQKTVANFLNTRKHLLIVKQNAQGSFDLNQCFYTRPHLHQIKTAEFAWCFRLPQPT